MFEFISFSLCSFSAFIWLTLIFMPERWDMSEHWDTAKETTPTKYREWPKLSVIIPARNESESLPTTLPSWFDQDYPDSEIILIDDESIDATSECARKIAQKYGKNIRIIKGTSPPSGWTGKLWALEQGIAVSSGEWLLFTDADIYHDRNVWKGLITKAVTEKKDMVSLMALLYTHGMWPRLLIPAFVFFFYLLYPFHKVKDKHSRIAAAAGGCILISRHALQRIGGLTGHRDAWIDDIALARRLKYAGFSLSLSLTRSVMSVRPYYCLLEVWNMVSRTAFTQLNCSWLALFGTVLGMALMFLVPILGIITSFFTGTSSLVLFISCWCVFMMAIIYLPAVNYYNLGMWRAFSLPFVGIVYTAMTISSAMNFLNGSRQWRGRVEREK